MAQLFRLDRPSRQPIESSTFDDDILNSLTTPKSTRSEVTDGDLTKIYDLISQMRTEYVQETSALKSMISSLVNEIGNLRKDNESLTTKLELIATKVTTHAQPTVPRPTASLNEIPSSTPRTTFTKQSFAQVVRSSTNSTETKMDNSFTKVMSAKEKTAAKLEAKRQRIKEITKIDPLAPVENSPPILRRIILVRDGTEASYDTAELLHGINTKLAKSGIALHIRVLSLRPSPKGNLTGLTTV